MKKNLGLAGLAASIMAAVTLFGVTAPASAATGVQRNDAVITNSFVDGSLSAGATSDGGRLVWTVGAAWRQPFAATVMITQITSDGEKPVDFWKISGGVDAQNPAWIFHDGILTAVAQLPAAAYGSYPEFVLNVERPDPNTTYVARILTFTEDQLLVQAPTGAGLVAERTLH